MIMIMIIISELDRQILGKNHSFSIILTATDLTALISFLLSRFFTILLTCVICMLLLNLISLIQIPAICIQLLILYNVITDLNIG